jgi:hypothetical protein
MVGSGAKIQTVQPFHLTLEVQEKNGTVIIQGEAFWF